MSKELRISSTICKDCTLCKPDYNCENFLCNYCEKQIELQGNDNSVEEFQRQTDENAMKFISNLQIPDTKRNFPEIVVLCGSTRFFQLFNQYNQDFTLKGKIVLSIGNHASSDKEIFSHPKFIDKIEKHKIELDELHKRKIDLADRVFVINKNGYIGDSTRSEINYAIEHNKPVEYMEVQN